MIEAALNEDLPAIMALEQEAFRATERWSEHSWQEELTGKGRMVLVARGTDGVLQGVAVSKIVVDVADIQRVMVGCSYQRQGIGTALLLELLDWTRKAGANRVLLEVSSRNEPAIQLYRSLGFQSLTFRADYYGKGEDACILQVSIAPTVVGRPR